MVRGNSHHKPGKKRSFWILLVSRFHQRRMTIQYHCFHQWMFLNVYITPGVTFWIGYGWPSCLLLVNLFLFCYCCLFLLFQSPFVQGSAMIAGGVALGGIRWGSGFSHTVDVLRSWSGWRWSEWRWLGSIFVSTPPFATRQTCLTKVWVQDCHQPKSRTAFFLSRFCIFIFLI